MKWFLCVLGLAAVLGGCGDPGEKYVRSVLMEAELGDAQAQFELGELRWDGTEDLAKDYEEAVKWYRKAAEQGHAEAQNNLGIMYVRGEGVAKDDAESVKWLRKSADQGLAEAQYMLGMMYGTGVAKDDEQAVKWYRKSAEQGDERAIEALKELGVQP